MFYTINWLPDTSTELRSKLKIKTIIILYIRNKAWMATMYLPLYPMSKFKIILPYLWSWQEYTLRLIATPYRKYSYFAVNQTLCKRVLRCSEFIISLLMICILNDIKTFISYWFYDKVGGLSFIWILWKNIRICRK